MPNTHTTLTGLFTDIADAIREKSGGTGAIVADNFPTAIREIATPLLPDGYTQVEYIESTGTQFIDTGFIPNQDTRIVIKMMKTTSATAEDFFGARTTSSSKYYGMYMYNSYWRSAYDNNIGLSTTKVVQNEVVTLDKNKNVLYINGIEDVSSTYVSFSCECNATLFGINQLGTVTCSPHKVYFCQIYDNDVLVRDYVPCVNENEVAGLYDVVNRVFYGNDGTGEFGYSSGEVKAGTVTADDSTLANAMKLNIPDVNFEPKNFIIVSTRTAYHENIVIAVRRENNGTVYHSAGTNATVSQSSYLSASYANNTLTISSSTDSIRFAGTYQYAVW